MVSSKSIKAKTQLVNFVIASLITYVFSKNTIKFVLKKTGTFLILQN